MKQRLALILYLPPPKVGHAAVFWDHLQSYKRRTDLLVYSDHPWQIPGIIALKGSVEQFRDVKDARGIPNKFGMANATFFAGLKIAFTQGYSHVMVLEPDVRVGRDYWDETIWDEYFDLGFPFIAAGTLATHNPCNWSPLATQRWAELVKKNPRKNFPIATYGWTGSGIKAPSMVFPNGALAIYDVAWMNRFFDLANIHYHELAQKPAWDFWIGQRIWEVFAEDSYLVAGHLDCIYSGYGDIITTEQMRQELLTSGEACAVHQVKSPWVPKK